MACIFSSPVSCDIFIVREMETETEKLDEDGTLCGSTRGDIVI